MERFNDMFAAHEGVFTKEKDNICNLPKLANIEIHRSNETGKYYLTFIEWMSGWNDGLWQDQEITEYTARMMLAFCYPDHIGNAFGIDLKKRGV